MVKAVIRSSAAIAEFILSLMIRISKEQPDKPRGTGHLSGLSGLSGPSGEFSDGKLENISKVCTDITDNTDKPRGIGHLSVLSVLSVPSQASAKLLMHKNLECIVKVTLLFLMVVPASAHDFGVRGKIAPITEADPIVLIQNKLKNMEERGELERHNLELQKKTRAAIERPKPVEGITNAQHGRVFYYDPTYIVSEDLKDHQGRIFYKKGARINPLETVSLSQGLLFFDGDDADQVTFAKEKLNQGPIKLILTKGAPLALSEEWKMPVYFDQSGILTKKLGIHHVPARVTQEGPRLRIEEIQKEDL